MNVFFFKKAFDRVGGISWKSPACLDLHKNMYPKTKSNCLRILHSNKFIATGGQFEI